MANIFTEAMSSINKVVSAKIKLRSLSRKQILDIIDTDRNQIRIINRVIDDLTTNDFKVLIDKLNKAHNSLDSKKYPNFYSQFVGKLTPKAKSTEQEKPFSTIKNICDRAIFLLDELESKIDKYIEDEEVTLFKLRVTNVIIIGMLEDLKMFGRYSSILFSYTTSIVTGDVNNIQGYKVNYLLENQQKYANMVSQVTEKRGIYMILQDVTDLKRSQNDPKLFINQKFSTDTFQLSKLSMGATGVLKSGLFGLGIFASVLEKYDQLRHAYYRRIETDRDAMIARVSILKLELMDKDSNSEDYRKAANIIKRYEQMIVECDIKIDSYKNS